MIVKVTFSSSACEYHYKVAPNVKLLVGKTYKITNDCGHTYNNNVTITGFLSTSAAATRTIVNAILVEKENPMKAVKTLAIPVNTPRSRKAPRMADLVKNIIFNGPATIVFWKDGTKTMVKCDEKDISDKSKAIALCFMKKMFGNTSEFNTVLRTYVPEAYIEPVEPTAPIGESNVFISHFGDSSLFNMFNDGGVAITKNTSTTTKANTSDTSISDAIETLMKIIKEVL